MSHVELPRPLEAYLAHAELDGAADGRRFTITLPYFYGARLDRLQWWWSLSAGQLRVGGSESMEQAKRVATLRFCQHIEHWLATNNLALRGEDPIPRLGPAVQVLPAPSQRSEVPLQMTRSG